MLNKLPDHFKSRIILPTLLRAYLIQCMHIESNNYKMFNRQARYKNDNYFLFGFLNAGWIFHKCIRVEIYYCISLQIQIIVSA